MLHFQRVCVTDVLILGQNDPRCSVFSGRVSFYIACMDVTTGLGTLAYRTYVVSAPIIAYYYTQMIGDAKKPPTLRAGSNFSGIAVIGAPFLAFSLHRF